MLHYEDHRQACHERLQRFRREAEAERLAHQLRAHRHRRRLALAAGLDLLLRARRHADAA